MKCGLTNHNMKTINRFTDLNYAKKVAKDYDVVISLGHPLKSDERPEKYLFLDFEDFDDTDVAKDPSLADVLVTEEQIKELVDFIKSLKPTESLLIHCFAGYSRSPAATMMAMIERDKMNYYAALGLVKRNRIPDTMNVKPNAKMLSLYNKQRRPIE